MNHSWKFTYMLRHWKRLAWLSVRDYLSWVIMIITIIGSLLAFLPEEDALWLRSSVQFLWTHIWLSTLLLFLLLLVAVCIHWPRTRAVYKDKTSDIRVIIECCDLLRQDGLKVIHVVDTFDTELDRIITPRSLHGAFLTMCCKQNIDAEPLVAEQLEKHRPVSRDTKLPGRTTRYQLGTVIPLTVNGHHYCWTAFTRLQENGTIAITKDEYIRCLKQMWNNLAEPTLREEVVNVAVMGNRFVDLPAEFSTEQKIDLMIQTFFAVAREKACCRTLRICVHPTNVTDIDFSTYSVIIAHLAKRPVI